MSDGDANNHRPALGAHRLIGQGVGAALLRPGGEVDWWCPNHFEAPPLLWSILDPDGGSSKWLDVDVATWEGAPAGPTAQGVVRHGDQRIRTWDGLVTIAGGSALVRLVQPEGRACVLRHQIIAGGFEAPWVRWEKTASGITSSRGTGLRLVGVDRPAILDTELRFDVEALPGCWRGFALVASETDTAFLLAELESTMRAADAFEVQQLRRIRLPYRHPSRATDALRVLRALTDPATGAPVASPTTSLPEAPGGDRQFDYRFTWLRDSGLAVATAALLGRLDAADDYLAFVADLLDRYGTHLTPLTTTKGDPVPAEREILDVKGWGASTPVRVGNSASDQRQLDSVATIIQAVSVYVRCGGAMTRRTWHIVDRMATLLADAPFAETSGIWEIRTPARLVSEEVARWIGLDRANQLRRWFRPWVRRPEWAEQRDRARLRVEGAIDPQSGLLHQSFDEDGVVVDAAALLVCMGGFFRRDDPRNIRLARATIAALEEGPFLRRYLPASDGFTGREGAFVPTSWWAVSALAAVGDIDAAERRADQMCAQLPPMQSEEWDVERSEGLGNVPLLWSHMESARALFVLQEERIRERVGGTGLALWRAARYIRVRAGRHRSKEQRQYPRAASKRPRSGSPAT